MNRQLKDSIDAVRTIRIGDHLSDDAVVALMDIHRNLAEIEALGLSAYGHSGEHRQAVEHLYAICLRRSAAHQTLARRCRMIPSLFTLFVLPDTPVDERRLAVCLNRAFKVAAQWRSGTETDGMLACDALRCLVEAFAYVPEEDRKTDPDYRFLQQMATRWLSEMQPDGSWPGLPDREALRRLDLLSGFLSLSGDIRRNTVMAARLETAVTACRARLEARLETKDIDPLIRLALSVEQACTKVHDRIKKQLQLACSA